MDQPGIGKVALITGVTGQDGAYLAELLLDKGYTVHGIKRRSSSFNTGRIEHLYQDPHEPNQQFILHYGDMTDSTNLIRIVQETQPDEIYNLAAQSHVQVSFETAEYTANADALGTLRLLEAIRLLGLTRKPASTRHRRRSSTARSPRCRRRRRRPFIRAAPMRAAKLYAYWIVVNYREAYGMHASNGILFNHESPLRGETFVTRKITRAVAAIKLGFQDRLYLGNLDAERDWGHAREYVNGMWLMLQQPEPDDYVLATGKRHSVRYFVGAGFRRGGIEIAWQGEGLSEKGVEAGTDRVLVEIDPRYFRPTEVDLSARRSDKGSPEARLDARDRSGSSSARRWCARILQPSRRRSGGMPNSLPFSLSGKRVWVAGHRGMVGSALVRRLKREDCEIVTVDRDPRRPYPQAETERWIAETKPDAIFLAAAKVGGILANDTYRADFLYDNLMIEANVLKARTRGWRRESCSSSARAASIRNSPRSRSTRTRC